MNNQTKVISRILRGLSDILFQLRKGGFKAAWQLLTSRLYRRSVSLLYFCRTVASPAPIPPELTIEVVTADKASAFHSDLVSAGAVNDLRLFERGATCYLARWAGVPVGAGWLFRESYLLERAGCEPNARYLGAFQVAERARGKGIYTALLSTMCRDVLKAGNIPYIDTTPGNIASQRGIEKAGFTCLGTLRTTVVLGVIVRCRLGVLLDSLAP